MKTTTRIKQLFMLAVIAVSMLTLASCGKNDPAPADEIPMKELIVGSWEVVKIERYKDGAYQEETPDGWIITYTADGEFMEYLLSKPESSGTYTLAGDQLTINYKTGSKYTLTLTFPDKDTLVMVDKKSKDRITYQRTEAPVPVDEAQLKELLVGSWKQVKVEKYKDGAYQEETPDGWIITYTADEEFMEYLDGKLKGSGTYTLAGDELTVKYKTGNTYILTLTFPDKNTQIIVIKSNKDRITSQRTE